MSTVRDIDRVKRNLKQPLKPGTSVSVWLTTEAPKGKPVKHDLSVLLEPTEAAQVLAVLDIRYTDGRRAPVDAVLPYFVVVAYDPTGRADTETVGTTLAVPGNTVLFQGPVKPIKDRVARLRLKIDTPADATPEGYVLETTQFSGWWIEP